jgi:hypothetical protein
VIISLFNERSEALASRDFSAPTKIDDNGHSNFEFEKGEVLGDVNFASIDKAQKFSLVTPVKCDHDVTFVLIVFS